MTSENGELDASVVMTLNLSCVEFLLLRLAFVQACRDLRKEIRFKEEKKYPSENKLKTPYSKK